MTPQLELFKFKEPIETVVIAVKPEMPLEAFLQLHHLAFFMELMERLPDGRVVWNSSIEEMYSENVARAEYEALQRGWIEVCMEIPKVVVEQISETPE